SADDDDVELGHALELVDGGNHTVRRVLSLDQRGREHDARAAATKGDLGDVVDRRARLAGHHAYHRSMSGKWSLSLRREETFRKQLVLQVLQRLEERATPRGSGHVTDELESPPGSPDGRRSPKPQASAVDDQLARAKR